MAQLSPLVSLVSGPVSCVPPYKASQEVSCPGAGPGPGNTTILVRETPGTSTSSSSRQHLEVRSQNIFSLKNISLLKNISAAVVITRRRARRSRSGRR